MSVPRHARPGARPQTPEGTPGEGEFCEQCGIRVAWGDDSCPNCGWNLVLQRARRRAARAREGRHKRKARTTAVYLAILCLTAFGAWIVVQARMVLDGAQAKQMPARSPIAPRSEPSGSPPAPLVQPQRSPWATATPEALARQRAAEAEVTAAEERAREAARQEQVQAAFEQVQAAFAERGRRCLSLPRGTSLSDAYQLLGEPDSWQQSDIQAGAKSDQYWYYELPDGQQVQLVFRKGYLATTNLY